MLIFLCFPEDFISFLSFNISLFASTPSSWWSSYYFMFDFCALYQPWTEIMASVHVRSERITPLENYLWYVERDSLQKSLLHYFGWLAIRAQSQGSDYWGLLLLPKDFGVFYWGEGRGRSVIGGKRKNEWEGKKYFYSYQVDRLIDMERWRNG